MANIPARKPLKIWVNEAFHYRFEWLIQTKTSSLPQDLTEYTGIWIITPLGSTTPWRTYTESLTNTGSGIVFNGQSGFIDLIISEAEAKEIGWDQAIYELKVVDPSTHETIALLTGRLTPEPSKS